jgi:hypothetical protein
MAPTPTFTIPTTLNFFYNTTTSTNGSTFIQVSFTLSPPDPNYYYSTGQWYGKLLNTDPWTALSNISTAYHVVNKDYEYYYVHGTVTDGLLSFLSANSNVCTLQFIDFTITADSTTIPSGSTVNITCINTTSLPVGTTLSFSWTATNGNITSSTTLSTITAQPINFTNTPQIITYQCTVTDGVYASLVSSIQITVNPSNDLSFTISPSSPLFLYDSTSPTYYGQTLLTSNYSSSSSSTYSVSNYQWYLNNVAIPSSTLSTYTITSVTTQPYTVKADFTFNGTTYHITSSNSPTPTNEDLSMSPPISFVFSNNEISFGFGGSYPSLTFLWTWTSVSTFINGNIIDNASPDTTVQPFFTGGTSPQRATVIYQVNVSNGEGATLTSYYNLDVDSQVFISTSPFDTTVVNGNPITLTAEIYDNTNITFEWLDNRSNILPTTQSFSYDPSIYASGYTGTIIIFIRVTNIDGFESQNVKTITILPSPTITVFPSSPNFLVDTTYSRNGTTLLSSSTESGFSLSSLQWYYGDDTMIVGANSSTYSFSSYPPLPSTFYMNATISGYGNTFPSSVSNTTSIVSQKNFSWIVPISHIYANTPISMSVTNISGITYAWSSSSPNANITSVTNTNSITAQPTNTTSSTITIRYNITITDGQGATLNTYQDIDVDPAVTITASANETKYLGNSITFVATALNVSSYEWYYTSSTYSNHLMNFMSGSNIYVYEPNNLIGNVKVYCKVTSTFGGISIQYYEITVLPNAILPKNTIEVYYTDKLVLEAQGGNTYTWEPVKKSPYLSASCYPSFDTAKIEFTPERDLEYVVTAYDEMGNEDSTTLFIKVIDKPMKQIDIDILPIFLYENVMQRNTNQIIQKLKKNTTLLKQLTEFYNVVLMNAYKTKFQAKQGRGYRVPWITKYQITNQKNEMLLSFTQQYEFLQYLLKNNHSHFLFLTNIIQYNFVLPSCKVQKNYYIQK